MYFYELDSQSRDLNTDFTLGNYLLEAAKLPKNAGKINTGIGVILLDSIYVYNFHSQTVARVIMLFLWC